MYSVLLRHKVAYLLRAPDISPLFNQTAHGCNDGRVVLLNRLLLDALEIEEPLVLLVPANQLESGIQLDLEVAGEVPDQRLMRSPVGNNRELLSGGEVPARSAPRLLV